MTLAVLMYLALGEITTTEPDRIKQQLMIEYDGFLNVLLEYGVLCKSWKGIFKCVFTDLFQLFTNLTLSSKKREGSESVMPYLRIVSSL